MFAFVAERRKAIKSCLNLVENPGATFTRSRIIAALTAIILLTLLLSPLLYPLDPTKTLTQYVHDSWGIDDDLPQSSVNCITQTGDGYLWLGTEEGLVRFDGVRFTVYDKSNFGKISENFITSLYADRDGNLWFGTYGGGLTCRNTKNGNFTTYTPALPDTGEDVSANVIKAILQDKNGNLWIGTDNGLCLFKNSIFTNHKTKKGPPNNKIGALLEDRNGNLWIGTENGLNLWNKKTGQANCLPPPFL